MTVYVVQWCDTLEEDRCVSIWSTECAAQLEVERLTKEDCRCRNRCWCDDYSYRAVVVGQAGEHV